MSNRTIEMTNLLKEINKRYSNLLQQKTTLTKKEYRKRENELANYCTIRRKQIVKQYPLKQELEQGKYIL